MDSTPIFLYAFYAPVHDNPAVQVAIMAVAILIVLDFLFGMVGAIINKNWDSSKVRRGLAHKCGEFGFLVVADVIDALLFAGIDLPFEIPNGCALMFVAVSLILMEISSIMENIVKINPELSNNKFFQLLDSVHVISLPNEETEEAPKEDEDDA